MYTKYGTIEHLDLFDMDEIFNEFNTKRNKIIDISHNKCVSQLVCDIEFYLHIKPEIQINVTEVHLKKFYYLALILFCYKFSIHGYNISHM